MTIISHTGRQRHDRRVSCTRIYLHILLGRKGTHHLYEPKDSTHSIAKTLVKCPEAHVRPQVVHAFALPDDTPVTCKEVDPDTVDALAEWLCSPFENDGEIDLFGRWEDMPDVTIDDETLSSLNALRVAMAVTGGAPTDEVRNPAIAFNDELERSIVDRDKTPRLSPKSRFGRMTDDEYARERERARQLNVLWPSEFADAIDIAWHIVSACGTRFHLTWPPKTADDAPRDRTRRENDHARKKFAGGHISPDDLVCFDEDGNIECVKANAHALDPYVTDIYLENQDLFHMDTRHFRVTRNGSLLDTRTDDILVRMVREPRSSRIDVIVTDELYRYLASQPNWNGLACTVLEREMEKVANGTYDDGTEIEGLEDVADEDLPDIG